MPHGNPLDYAIRALEEAERTGATKVDLSRQDIGQFVHDGWSGWQTLGRLHWLQELDLSHTGISSLSRDAWEALGQLTALRVLDLSWNGIAEIPPEGFEALGRLTALENLDLSSNSLTSFPPGAWAALQRTSLRELYLHGNGFQRISDEGWKVLSRMNLRGLGLSGNGLQISEVGWEALGKLKGLEILRLNDNDLGEPSTKAWRALGNLGRLTDLGLGCAFNDLGWRMIGQLSNLMNLWLGGTPSGWFQALAGRHWGTFNGCACFACPPASWTPLPRRVGALWVL